jgi:hypothetical protein
VNELKTNKNGKFNNRLKITYNSELLQIAFTKLPDEKEVKIKMKTLIDRLK